MTYKRLRSLGLSNMATRCYEALDRNGGMTAKTLAEKLSVNRTAVYRILKQLEKRGFVNMLKTHAQPIYYYPVPLVRALESYFAYQERAVAPLIHEQKIKQRQAIY